MIKKGCLLRTIGFFVIIAAVLVYFFDKYGKEFYESSKEKLYESFVTQLEDQIKSISTDAISDSIKNNFQDKLTSLKRADLQTSHKDMKNIIDEIKSYIDKNTEKIDNFDELLKIIKDYEQREKN